MSLVWTDAPQVGEVTAGGFFVSSKSGPCLGQHPRGSAGRQALPSRFWVCVRSDQETCRKEKAVYRSLSVQYPSQRFVDEGVIRNPCNQLRPQARLAAAVCARATDKAGTTLLLASQALTLKDDLPIKSNTTNLNNAQTGKPCA